MFELPSVLLKKVLINLERSTMNKKLYRELCYRALSVCLISRYPAY